MRYVLLALFLAITISLNAQKADTMIIEIEEVLVNENRIRLPYYDKPASISLIRNNTVDLIPVSGISDLLHYQAGVDIRSRGVKGIQNDVSIRGSSFDQVLILVNGIKISDPQTGHHSLNLAVDPAAIKNIEIYKGPAARVFGQNAFAGAINIITQVADRNKVDIKISAGDYGLFGAGAGITFGNTDNRNSLNISYNKSNGYKYNTDFKLGKVFYQSDILTNAGRLKFIGGISQRSFGANGFYASPDYKDQYEDVRTTMASLSFTPAKSLRGLNISSRLYWRNNRDEYLFIRSDPEYYRNLHATNIAGIDINITSKNSLGISGLGVDLSGSEIASNSLGNRNRYGITFFLDHSFSAFNNKLTITPGFQAFVLSEFNNKILPGLDMGYILSENVMLYFNSGYTYRVPTFTDLYYEDPVNSSNPDLEAEYAFSNEIGIKSRRIRGISSQLSLFHRRGNKMIDRVKQTADELWIPVNINRVVFRGFDTSLELRMNEILNSGTFLLKYINISYCHINSYVDDKLPEFSKWKFENLKDQFAAVVVLEYTRGLTQSFNYRYYNRVNMDSYSLFDSRINWKKKNFDIFIDLTNIVNIEYRETNLVTMPGRWFSVGIKYSLNSAK